MGCADNITYSTIKIVTIKDRCLGFLHYFFLTAIFLYIVIYKLVYQTGYVLFEQPIGTARLQLQAPTVDHCDPDYFKPTCFYDFTDVSKLPYCSQSGNATYNGFKTLPCRDLDAFTTVFPVTGGSPFFVATRIMESNQTLYCSQPAPGEACKKTYRFGCRHSFMFDEDCPADEVAQDNYFVANIEDFTVLIDHSVRSPTVQALQADSVDMDGYLEGCNGEKIFPPTTSEKQDILRIGTLLDVMQNVEDSTAGNCGLSLDEASTVATSHASVRSDGLIMILLIEYTNTDPWKGPRDTISYKYKVEFIKGTKSKIPQEIFVKYPELRVTRDIHGIKIVVIQTGELGSYDTTTLLLQLTTSLTLLAVATTLVDVLATRVLPARADYKAVKYEEFVHDETSGEMVASPHSGRISIYGSMGPAPSGGSLQSRNRDGAGATRQRHAASAAGDIGRHASGGSGGQTAAASASQVLLAHPAGSATGAPDSDHSV